MINSTPELNLIKLFHNGQSSSIIGDYLEPHRITFYLINLASEFHSFGIEVKLINHLNFYIMKKN